MKIQEAKKLRLERDTFGRKNLKLFLKIIAWQNFIYILSKYSGMPKSELVRFSDVGL